MRGSATSNLGSYLCALAFLLSISGQTTASHACHMKQ